MNYVYKTLRMSNKFRIDLSIPQVDLQSLWLLVIDYDPFSFLWINSRFKAQKKPYFIN